MLSSWWAISSQWYNQYSISLNINKSQPGHSLRIFETKYYSSSRDGLWFCNVSFAQHIAKYHQMSLKQQLSRIKVWIVTLLELLLLVGNCVENTDSSFFIGLNWDPYLSKGTGIQIFFESVVISYFGPDLSGQLCVFWQEPLGSFQQVMLCARPGNSA